MSRDTFLSIANEVRGQTGLDIELCKLHVRDSFRELQERNTPWSWQLKRGLFTAPAPYTTGTATIANQFDTLVTLGGGAVVSSAFIGRQFRLGVGDPYYDIIGVDSGANTITLLQPWADTPHTASSYTISQTFFLVPDDFYSFLVVYDPLHSWRLNLNVPQSTLDWWDTKRSNSGNPVLLSPVDYTPSYAGKVGPALAVVNTGSPTPSTGGSYAGSTDSVIFVQITATGALDAATFSWSKDGGTLTTGVPVSSAGNILPENIGLSWPSGTYKSGDIFIIQVRAVSNPGTPRFEIYPAPSEQLIFPYQYVSKYPDISDFGTTIPRFIPGSFIKEGALAKAARTAGTEEKPNPYAQIARAQNHEDRFTEMISLLAQNDQEVFTTSIFAEAALPYAPLPWGSMLGGGRALTYDPIWMYPDVGIV